MSKGQPPNKRKRFWEEELEGTSTSNVAPIQQSLPNENDIPSWTTVELQDLPCTQPAPQYQEIHQQQTHQLQYQVTQQQTHQPQYQETQHQLYELPPPSDGLDMSSVFGQNMNLERSNRGEINDPVHDRSWMTYPDQQPTEAFNRAYAGYFQGFQGYQSGSYYDYSMEENQDFQDPDQPGPSHVYHPPQPEIFFDLVDDLHLSVCEDVSKETEERVRDESNELLVNWKDRNWRSNGWKELEKECIENFGCFPSPPPPAVLYERKKNGRKMHPENEIDPYFHLTDKDALTLMEGKRRGNEMLKTGIEKWQKAKDKQEAAKLLWKDILARVINNRQSTSVKTRLTDMHGNFSRATLQVCDAASRYRDLLESFLTEQMISENVQREMEAIDQTIFMPYEEDRTLLDWVRNTAENEANKKPTTRHRTMSKEEKNNKDKKKK